MCLVPWGQYDIIALPTVKPMLERCWWLGYDVLRPDDVTEVAPVDTVPRGGGGLLTRVFLWGWCVSVCGVAIVLAQGVCTAAVRWSKNP